jgi:drug/metabolite transporter (DMT)-like permease
MSQPAPSPGAPRARHPHAAPLEIVLAAILFSTGGAAIKATQFSSWQVAGLRSVFAGAVIFRLLPMSRRNWTWAKAAIGLAYAMTMILFVAANKLTTSMNTIFLQDTAPLYVLLLSPVLLREAVHAKDLVSMAVIVVGLALFFVGVESPQTTAPNPVAGNVIAVLSGVAWALTIMGLRWLAKMEPQDGAALPAIIVGNLVAIAVCLPMSLPFPAGRPADWLIVAFLGVFQVGLAYVFLSRGLIHTPATTASILLLAEPVFNPIWAFLVHREAPGGWAISGAVLILIATLLRAWTAAEGPPPQAS